MHRVALALALTVPAVGCSRHNAAPAPAATAPAANRPGLPPQMGPGIDFEIRALDPGKVRPKKRRLV